MRAAVTSAERTMAIADVPEPRRPGPAEAIVRPEAVGICGSDFHLFLGELGPLFPRIQGHEVCAVVDEVGLGVEGVRPGDRVALWPVLACGECYPCSVGRGNACSRIRILGVHLDGALQERLLLPAAQLFPVGDQELAVAALVEPVSIGVRTVGRARIDEGERVVVLGAGPIGQGVTLAARDRGASVLLVDRIASRLEHGGLLGADVLEVGDGADLVAEIRDWSGGEGPPVVVDATGSAKLIQAAVHAVATAGRVVVVGISEEVVEVGGRIACPPRARPARRELLLGRGVRGGGGPGRSQPGARGGARHARVPLRADSGRAYVCAGAPRRGHEGRDPNGRLMQTGRATGTYTISYRLARPCDRSRGLIT